MPEEDRYLFISMFNKNIKKSIFKKYDLKSFTVVASVAKNSPANKSNLLPNDIILEINDKIPLNFRMNLHNALSSKSKLKLKILRKKNTLDIFMQGKKICNYCQPWENVCCRRKLPELICSSK